MNKVYDFGWLIREMYDNYVLSVYDKSHLVGIYQISGILTNGLDNLKVRFANVDDLTNFATQAVIRFSQIINNENILDMPIRNLYMLNKYSTNIGENDKFVDRNTLEIFGLINGEIIHDPITISIHKITECSSELLDIMNITKEFNNLDMQKKIDALNKINIINYNKEKINAFE